MANTKKGRCGILNVNRKVRADAKLKNLPEARQDEIAEFARTNSLMATMKWLGEAGVTISLAPLGEFLSQYRIRRQMERNAAAVEAVMFEKLKQDPSLTPQRVQELGQLFFSGMAIEKENPRVWEMMQQIELKKGKLQLEQQKHRDKVKQRRAKMKQRSRAAKKGGGISGETLEQIERELKLL